MSATEKSFIEKYWWVLGLVWAALFIWSGRASADAATEAVERMHKEITACTDRVKVEPVANQSRCAFVFLWRQCIRLGQGELLHSQSQRNARNPYIQEWVVSELDRLEAEALASKREFDICFEVESR